MFKCHSDLLLLELLLADFSVDRNLGSNKLFLLLIAHKTNLCLTFQTMKEVVNCSVDVRDVLVTLVTTQDNVMQCVAAKILYLLVENDRLN